MKGLKITVGVKVICSIIAFLCIFKLNKRWCLFTWDVSFDLNDIPSIYHKNCRTIFIAQYIFCRSIVFTRTHKSKKCLTKKAIGFQIPFLPLAGLRCTNSCMSLSTHFKTILFQEQHITFDCLINTYCRLPETVLITRSIARDVITTCGIL